MRVVIIFRMTLESEVRTSLTRLYEHTPCMPLIVRLAFHDSGTYNAKADDGGANGTVRFAPESHHFANTGLEKGIALLQPIKDTHPDISYADLYQLASVVAIEFTGGPKIPFRMGRVDATNDRCTPDGRLPDGHGNVPHLRDVFHRMGLTDKDIVVLSGAHTLGRAHRERSGFEGPWTKEPLKFDNSYYQELLSDAPDPSLLRLATDLALVQDPRMKSLVEIYASDQDAFFADYAESHKKLSELGSNFKE